MKKNAVVLLISLGGPDLLDSISPFPIDLPHLIRFFLAKNNSHHQRYKHVKREWLEPSIENKLLRYVENQIIYTFHL